MGFFRKVIWLDVLRNNKLLKHYSPDKILSLNLSCNKNYKEIYGKNVKKYLINHKLNQSNKIIDNLRFKGKKNIFFPGTHDANELIRYLDNLDLEEKKNFIIKLHPKTKLKNHEHKLILKNQLNKININKKKLKILRSNCYKEIKKYYLDECLKNNLKFYISKR